MKKKIFFILFPFIGFGQIQIGADIDGESAGDYSGTSVSLSSDGSTLAIGANHNDGRDTDSGSVRVYKNILGIWTKLGADIDGEGFSDYSGWSVSLSSDGTILAIGAPYNSGNGNNSGSVKVYKYISGTWTQLGANINGEATDDQSGWSVSLSADGAILAIGAHFNAANGIYSGSVRVYKYISGIWTQIGADIDGEAAFDTSGDSVSLSADGTILAIGAHGNDGNGDGAGSVRVYKNILGIWTKLGADIDGEAVLDSSGLSISLSADGAILAIGAMNNDVNGNRSGSVRVYKNILGTWTKLGADIDGQAAFDSFGNSVSLSNDGTYLAIGAYEKSGNGFKSGSVSVYKNISGNWIKIGIDINGEAANDISGWSVALSNDGTTVAIGAIYNDGNGSDSGSVRVYNLSAILSSDFFFMNNFSVFPNPASDQVTISLKEGFILEKVNIYNNLGQLVKTEKSNVITVNSLVKGNYIFEIISNKGKASKKILIK